MSKESVEEAIQAAKDAKDRAKAEKAYNDASTTPPAPKSAPAEKKAKGGYVKAADGIAQRGKTRGTMVMCGGGMSKGK
jgi:hypothetical protein